MKLHVPIARGLDGQLSRFRLPGARLLRHRHPELELDHVLRGRATLLIGHSPVELRPGSTLLLFPDQEHLVVEHTPDFEMWIACFRRRLIRRVCRGRELRWLRRRRSPGLVLQHLSHESSRHLRELLAEVSTYEDAATYNAGLGHILLHAAGELTRNEGGEGDEGNEAEAGPGSGGARIDSGRAAVLGVLTSGLGSSFSPRRA